MRSPLLRLLYLSVGALVGAASLAAHAQSLPPGVHLGMTAQELQAALPAAEPVPRPQRLSGGLLGSWRGEPATIGGLMFKPTYYFAGGELRRIEYDASTQGVPDGGEAAFSSLLQWGRAAFGNELAALDPGSTYVSWSSGELDVLLQRTGDARRASLRLIYKQRQLRDASEL
ncbi:hypothetical protein [Variovorax sp. YR216]|uniref:hypothetical protein n=1 Tax=Variovorax sp. YR216 TaxID=1882828 RepID=UPI0008999AC2|nr:hypothetical protein [Variovorax sp. YR216]SEA67840.1 hypothetical protein SAMN05444680_10385 [Variovorax sp. YR216]